MICTDPVLPLWPLGRAVNPQPTGARGPQDYMETGPTDVGRQRADFNAALNCGLGSVNHVATHLGQGAAVYHHPAMAAPADAANPNGSTESALDADLLQARDPHSHLPSATLHTSPAPPIHTSSRD